MLLCRQLCLDIPPERAGDPALKEVVPIEDLMGAIAHENGGKQLGYRGQQRLHSKLAAHEEAFVPEDSPFWRGGNAQNYEIMPSKIEQVGVVELTTT